MKSKAFQMVERVSLLASLARLEFGWESRPAARGYCIAEILIGALTAWWERYG